MMHMHYFLSALFDAHIPILKAGYTVRRAKLLLWERGVEVFSGLLIGLYRQAQIIPPTEFQVRALDAARDALAFDSALWARGAMGQEGAIPHTVFVYRQPPDMMESYERIKQHDILAFEAFSRMGQTVNAALTTDPYWKVRFHPDAMAHVKLYGMEHVLTSFFAEPVLRLFTALSFYRADPGRPFTEAERLFKQNLMPHLAEAWNINRLAFLTPASSNGVPPSHGQAICDIKGVLYNADRNFTGFMLAEWPDWQGPQLPRVLLDALSDEGRRQYNGHGIVATARTLNDMLSLRVREKSTVDQLSSRELEVARRFGRGMDFRKIANELHIAPVTVRNHLQAIYDKLGVSNKVEMARIIFEAED